MADQTRHQIFVVRIIVEEGVTEKDIKSAIKEGMERDLGVGAGDYIATVTTADNSTLGYLVVKERE